MGKCHELSEAAFVTPDFDSSVAIVAKQSEEVRGFERPSVSVSSPTNQPGDSFSMVIERPTRPKLPEKQNA